jgi:hypothetical protein
MAQFVIEFGAPTFDPVFAAVLSMIGSPTMIDTESRTGGGERFPATTDALQAVSRRFEGGHIVSATFRTESEGVRYGLITEPRYNGQSLSMWMGAVELTTDDWRRYWDALLRFEALVFVCVGEEEGVELADDSLTVASFPWDEWPTLAGALRTSKGKSEWVIRERTPIQSDRPS